MESGLCGLNGVYVMLHVLEDYSIDTESVHSQHTADLTVTVQLRNTQSVILIPVL